MGFLEDVGATLGRGAGGIFTPRVTGFRKTLRSADFQTSAVAVITTAFTKIGTYTVPAQQEISVGYGTANLQINQGFIYVSSKTTADGAMEGMFRVLVANANETKTDVIFEERTDKLSGSATDRANMIPLPEVRSYAVLGRRPREDDRIQIWFKPDTAGDWSPTHSTIYIPVTVYQ